MMDTIKLKHGLTPDQVVDLFNMEPQAFIDAMVHAMDTSLKTRNLAPEDFEGGRASVTYDMYLSGVVAGMVFAILYPKQTARGIAELLRDERAPEERAAERAG